MNGPKSRTLRGVGLSLAIAALAGCQASGGNGFITVRLVDGPSLEYSELNLHVLRVEISKDGEGWMTIGTPDVTVDLLTLTGGVAQTLVDGASVPAGTYGQLRLVLGAGNTIRTADGLHDLKVPSGMQSGVKLNVHFEVEPNTTKDVFVDFDAHRSVFVHQAGASLQYILRPVVRAFDRVVTGAVLGTVTDAGTGAPLAGVEVTAQTLDGSGHPAVARATTTAADGSYVLDLLPVDGAYWVVAQPRVGAQAYEAGAAGPLAITVEDPVLSVDLAFAAVASGGVAGAIAPPPAEGEFDEVVVLGTVEVDGTDRTFVLRTAPATAAEGAETYAIDLLPPGTYALFVIRATPDGDGGYAFAQGPQASASVSAGATASVALAAP